MSNSGRSRVNPPKSEAQRTYGIDRSVRRSSSQTKESLRSMFPELKEHKRAGRSTRSWAEEPGASVQMGLDWKGPRNLSSSLACIVDVSRARMAALQIESGWDWGSKAPKVEMDDVQR